MGSSTRSFVTYIVIPSALAEIATLGYLLVIGVKGHD
jgi:hypothetical protein